MDEPSELRGPRCRREAPANGGIGQCGQGLWSSAHSPGPNGPTFDYVQLINSSQGMLTGNFHTGDLTQLMINC